MATLKTDRKKAEKENLCLARTILRIGSETADLALWPEQAGFTADGTRRWSNETGLALLNTQASGL